jgi:hypothetical protein
MVDLFMVELTVDPLEVRERGREEGKNREVERREGKIER